MIEQIDIPYEDQTRPCGTCEARYRIKDRINVSRTDDEVTGIRSTEYLLPCGHLMTIHIQLLPRTSNELPRGIQLIRIS